MCTVRLPLWGVHQVLPCNIILTQSLYMTSLMCMKPHCMSWMTVVFGHVENTKLSHLGRVCVLFTHCSSRLFWFTSHHPPLICLEIFSATWHRLKGNTTSIITMQHSVWKEKVGPHVCVTLWGYEASYGIKALMSVPHVITWLHVNTATCEVS